MPIRALLVEDNPGDAGLVRAALAEDSSAVVDLTHVARLADALSVLRVEFFDCMLLDLSLPDSQGLHTVQRAHEAVPSMPIIVLTGLADDTMALSAVAEGVQDYLVKGEFDGLKLVRTMRLAIARSETAASRPAPAGLPPGGKLIGMLGAKAGVGVTTLSCHLALQLAAATRGKTLLADFNVTAGLVSFYLRCERPYTVLDAADNTERLDNHFWEALVTRADGLDIIGAPAILTWRAVPAPNRFREVLAFARQQYETTIVDLGHGYQGLVPAVFPDFDEIYLVTAPNLLALYRTRTVLDQLRTQNLLGERVHLVLNRIPKDPDLSSPELEAVLKVRIEASLPECAEDLRPFNLQGRLAPKSSTYSRPVQELISQLTGVAPEKPRRSFFAFFK